MIHNAKLTTFLPQFNYCSTSNLCNLCRRAPILYTRPTANGVLTNQPDGCVLVKTTQAILVAEYLAPVQQPEAVDVVEKLADYLISVGY